MLSKSASAWELEAHWERGCRFFVRSTGDKPLGNSGADMVRLDSYIGKMFKKERRKWAFLAK
jgi:hypothetical protein